MRIGRNTRRRISDVKHDLAETLTELEQYIARVKEHPGTKRMVVPLENAVEKIHHWKNTAHFD